MPTEENEDAINIFFLVQRQLIMGAKGPIDINHLAIHGAMRLYKIEKRQECFEKIKILSKWWIDEITDKNEFHGKWGKA